MEEEEVITALIKRAVAAPQGLIVPVLPKLILDFLGGDRFNTERAIEVFTIAIDNSVWAAVKEMHLGKLVYSDYRRTELGKSYAIELTEKFKAKAGGSFGPLEDQRPPRRFLRFLLGA